MITTNVVRRVFRIYHNKKTASAYTIEKDDKQFLVTAAHTFIGDTVVDELMILHENQWKKLKVKVVFNSMEHGDTIVFLLPHDIAPRYPISHGPGEVYMASWAYFLGFPLGLYSEGAAALNNNFPIPLVKAGLVSGIKFKEPNLTTVFLDGHNNKGFSGGPVVWSPNPLNTPFKIIATISGYMNEPVLASETMEDVETYMSNAGIIQSFWIKDLFDFI